MFGEGTGPNSDNAAKNINTNKPADGPIYGMVFETADPHFDKQVNTHFTAIATYLEKQVCFILIYLNKFFSKCYILFVLPRLEH